MNSTFTYLLVYSAAVVLASLMGGCLPVLGRVSHSRLQLYLSLSAGVMLGAAFFHVMPEAIEYTSSVSFGWWLALSVVGLFCIERFIAPHSHEPSGEEAGKKTNEYDHDHDHAGPEPSSVAGWMAVLGLTVHTFINGIGLGAAVQTDVKDGVAWALPGLSMFLAIVLHKPADALAISTLLRRSGVPLKRIGLVQFGFAVFVPLGACAFYLTRGEIDRQLQNQFTGIALALSAGTFLVIALSDLLPEVQVHRHDRIPLFLALVLGVGLMAVIALLEGHGHDHHDHNDHNDHQAFVVPQGKNNQGR